MEYKTLNELKMLPKKEREFYYVAQGFVSGIKSQKDLIKQHNRNVRESERRIKNKLGIY